MGLCPRSRDQYRGCQRFVWRRCHSEPSGYEFDSRRWSTPVTLHICLFLFYSSHFLFLSLFLLLFSSFFCWVFIRFFLLSAFIATFPLALGWEKGKYQIKPNNNPE